MTGLTETEHVVEGLDAGGVDYVTKPIVPGELLARIRVHLANARISHSARTALDASGRFLLAATGSGRPLWCTPQATRLLERLFPGFRLGPIRSAVAACRTGISNRGRSGVGVAADGPQGRCLLAQASASLVSQIGPDENLFRLIEGDPAATRRSCGRNSR